MATDDKPVPELTAEEIELIRSLDGPNAAGAHPHRIEDPDVVFELLEPLEFKSVEDVLSTLEVGADELAEVQTFLREDPSKCEWTQTPDDVAVKAQSIIKLLKQIREARIKHGGVIVADHDPLAKEKRKLANVLKKVGRTLDHLPTDYWTLPRIDGNPSHRSRTNELYRVQREGQAAVDETKRLQALKDKGRPENYLRLPLADRERVDAKIRKRRSRAKKPKGLAKRAAAVLPFARESTSEQAHILHKMMVKLEKYAALDSGARARQLRNRDQQLRLLKAALMYGRYYEAKGRVPSHAELAEWLKCSKDKARRKLKLLHALHEPGGPWCHP